MNEYHEESKQKIEPPLKGIKRRSSAGKGMAKLLAVSLLSGVVGAKIANNDQEPIKNSSPPVTTSVNNNEASNPSQAELLQIDVMQEKLDALSKIIASQAGVSIETVNGELPGPETLPGYGVQVSPEIRKSFESSVLKMGKRLKGETGPWEEVCTANKVSYEGKEYVVTAAHCLTGDMNGMVSPIKGGGEYSALDITDLSPYEYAVLEPDVPSTERQVDPIANVSSVSVMTPGGPDMALFTINSTPRFEAVESIPISDPTPYITPGVDVALRSLPASSGNEPITYKGVYLGRIENAYEIGSLSNTVEVVGLAGIDDETEDVCMYGASGSAAQTAEAPVFALSTRHQTDVYDNGGFDPLQPQESAYTKTLKIADTLGVDLSSFDVICSYSTVGEGDMERLLNPVPAVIGDGSMTGGK
ncbi:hypothetical protein KBB49_03225 [Candidatus Saccharibacteria bacterium]|nr:hypothetical protein [Candidatus Saccharibacteria bacterium]